MTPEYRPKGVQRIPEPMYAALEAVIVRSTGLDSDAAQDVVDAVIGPLFLAPATIWYSNDHPCRHAYWAHEGEWQFCLVRGPHDEHEDRRAESWKTGDARDVDMREFQ